MLFTVGSLDPKENEVIDRVNQMRESLRYNLAQPRRWSGLLRRATFARAIQGSNSIEGYNVTLDDAIAAVEDEDILDAETETVRAILGYRNAMTYVLQLANDPFFSYSETLIKSLHFMMISYDLNKHPGTWRPGWVGVTNEATNKLVYEGPDVELVPELMAELIACLQAADDFPPIIRAAMAHLNLVMIHPFSDGNGRMARCLQTLVLARERIVAPEFSSIEEYLGRNTQAYYDVLAEVGAGSWHPERNAHLWIKFCLTAHFRQAHTLLRRIKLMSRVWAEVEKITKMKGLQERHGYAIADAAIGLRVRNSTYRAMTDISLNLASRDLAQLADLGFLIPEGEKRGRFYMASKQIRDIYLREREREPRTEEDPFESSAFLPGLAPELAG
jgi:Fic family protein